MEGDTAPGAVRRTFWHFNPLPPHGGRQGDALPSPFAAWISIHSLRMEGDPTYQGKVTVVYGISIHSLRMEGDDIVSHRSDLEIIFQSTPSAWRETRICTQRRARMQNFNPLPPHGGRLLFSHAEQYTLQFQSTPSAWRETRFTSIFRTVFCISIHSLRMEGDLQYLLCYTDTADISIHSLRMEGDSKTAQESVFHFAYPCTILQKRMQKTTFCTRKNGFFRKKGEKFGAKPSASFCAPMIRTDTFPLNFSHRISGSSMSMVSFAPICSTFD